MITTNHATLKMLRAAVHAFLLQVPVRDGDGHYWRRHAAERRNP